MKIRNFVSYALVVASLGQTLPVRAAEHRIVDGTRISVRLMEPLSSEKVRSGDVVNFSMVDDLVVDGEVVVAKGTPVTGVVVQAAAKRRMGRAGKLSYALRETKATDRQVIRLRATQDNKGDSNVTGVAIATTAVAVFVPVAAPFMLLRKGKDIVVPEGTRVEAFVDGDHIVRSSEPLQPTTPAIAATSALGRLTNADILALRASGIGDDVLVARIAASAADFSLEASDLVRLKRAGVSDRVISAMLQVKR